MHICLVSEEYPPETGWGGIAVYSRHAALGHVANGHRVDVITRTWGPRTCEDDSGVRVHRVPLAEPTWRGGTVALTSSMWETRHTWMWSRAAGGVVRELHDADPVDVVEAPDYHAQAAAPLLLRRGPLVASRLHGPARLCRRVNRMATAGGSRFDSRLAESCEWLAVRRSDLVTAPSRAMASYIAGWGVDATVVPNPFDATEFVASSRSVDPDPRGLFFCGRIQPLKGIDTVIEALPTVLASFPDTVLRVAGDDHPSAPDGTMMKSHLQRRCAELGVEDVVEWLGFVPREQLATLYSQALVTLVPSRWETFPYSCLEAMAAGRGVVVSDAGALPDLVEHGVTGLVTPAGEPGPLADAVNALLDRPELALKMGRAAQCHVASAFRPDVVTARMAAIYGEALGRR